jgi:hypothetical protein
MAAIALCPHCLSRVEFIALYQRAALVAYHNSSVYGGDPASAPANRRWTLRCEKGHTWARAAFFEREWKAAGCPQT